MVYDLAALSSYVRFYLAVTQQIAAAWQKLVATHAAAQAALSPFAEPLAPVGSAALAAAVLPAAEPPAALAELWAPSDPEGLGGLTDVYEMVGRFSFQGEGNANLSRVQALVSAARNEIVVQRTRLADLARLAELAAAAADRLAATEASLAEAAQRERLAAFGPLADVVGARARQTSEAVRAVALPDLSNAETAAEDYRRYVGKVDQVYQTCLPFLRKAIAAMYESLGAEVPSSWPDKLPLVAEMPAELVSVPPADAPELKQAEASLLSLAEEERALARAREEIATALARLEGETAAALTRDNEVELEIRIAAAGLDHAIAEEQVAATQAAIEELDRQKVERVRIAGEVWQRQRRTEASIKALEEELGARAAEIAEAQEELGAAQKSEPVLFGKDEWRARVAALEARVAELRGAHAQRHSALNQLRIDLSAVSVQVQTEGAQTALVERTLADAKARLGAQQAALAELGARLGASRPPRGTSPADAQRALEARKEARAEVAARLERLKGETRRQKEENVRVLSRLKQIEVERQHAHARVQSAQVAATQGREAALQRLAAERRAAVEQHVGEVLGSLDRSLAGVEASFIAPARAALLAGKDAGPATSAVVREHAAKVAPVIEALARELDPELLAQEAALSQIQREFCDVAVAACRAAWG
ncbi:MAG: hypothetical protein IT372_11550 [Polyangiaceae bacterium]|nr:hypothetical protein [Polyangiaceae bacterium]